MKSRTIVVILGVAIFAASAVCQMQNANPTTPSSENSEVRVFSRDAVMASFAKGGTLINSSNYKVMTAQRTEAGSVEVHTKYADVFYIVEGGATIITGGKVIGQTMTSSDEPRGTSIEGGDPHEVGAGDVMVIPAGVPHWMKDIKAPMLYFVVKVKKAEQ
ncbi:MAG: cupin domain-containing protein [Terriglobales bacterium]|jgi:mannose-6-phosphate isomerase-like protein (cupin superfamily)|nr:cupin domain-containing protein [Terriglobales bacterium]